MNEKSSEYDLKSLNLEIVLIIILIQREEKAFNCNDCKFLSFYCLSRLK